MSSPDLLLTFALLTTAGGMVLAATRPAPIRLRSRPIDPLQCGLFGCYHSTAQGAIFCRAMRTTFSPSE